MAKTRNAAPRAVSLAVALCIALGLSSDVSAATRFAVVPVPMRANQAESTPTPASSPATPGTPASPLPAPRITAVPDTPEQQRATDLMSGEAGVYGFVVLEADGTVVASHNGTLPFITASTYKLILMADIYHRIERGELAQDSPLELDPARFDDDGDMYFSYDDLGASFPLQDYLFAVGAYSSNAAARTLLSLTSRESLRETAVAIGMDDTYLFVDPDDLPGWPPQLGIDGSEEDLLTARTYLEESAREAGDVNITTPLDMARYQLGLINGTLISPWVSGQIADILKQQLIRDRLPYYLEDTPTLDKPGNLDDAVNDVGVIYLAEGPRAVAMLAQAVPDTERSTEIEQRLALIAAGAEDIPPLSIDEDSEWDSDD